MAHLMFGVLALTMDQWLQLGRQSTKADLKLLLRFPKKDQGYSGRSRLRCGL